MSDELQKQVNDLNTEIANLNQRNLANSQGAEGLMAQLDAHKGMLNESLTASLQLKAQCLIFERHITRLNEAAVETQKVIEALNAKVKSYEDAKSAEVPSDPQE